jgi:hypothetical protein
LIEVLLGTSLGVFLGLTLMLFGGAAFMTGQALAGTWRPVWQILPYALLMALGDRFLTFALFGGRLLSLSGFLSHAVVLGAIMYGAFRLTAARKMVAQYPWLYERAGPFGWKQKA